ncbi:hypothetical protein SLEP1_g50823 [Rubroshorea leprosula]|uniref:Uncharacterized protein n=1 Tax=Rubroshorea leprosula TaxID=152421 RepID=A0AAV5M4R7_9ROSI|nr:hypothetical protein SLEP1_g50823 [Rubroshorea leprosula]
MRLVVLHWSSVPDQVQTTKLFKWVPSKMGNVLAIIMAAQTTLLVTGICGPVDKHC